MVPSYGMPLRGGRLGHSTTSLLNTRTGATVYLRTTVKLRVSSSSPLTRGRKRRNTISRSFMMKVEACGATNVRLHAIISSPLTRDTHGRSAVLHYSTRAGFIQRRLAASGETIARPHVFINLRPTKEMRHRNSTSESFTKGGGAACRE